MIGFIQSTTYNDTGHARRKPHRAGALVRPSTAARLHSICPALPSSLLGDFITRLTPRSLVTFLELLFPIPPYCRRPFCFSLIIGQSLFSRPTIWTLDPHMAPLHPSVVFDSHSKVQGLDTRGRGPASRQLLRKNISLDALR